MTREEAIQVLIEISATLKSWSGFSEYPQAIDMAIESLQKDIERHEMVIRASERHLGIVRCKDCRHRDLFSCPLAENDFQKDDDFCSWGERKEPLPQYAEWKEPFKKMTEGAKVGDHDD